jgi:hypothetical protein
MTANAVGHAPQVAAVRFESLGQPTLIGHGVVWVPCHIGQSIRVTLMKRRNERM